MHAPASTPRRKASRVALGRVIALGALLACTSLALASQAFANAPNPTSIVIDSEHVS
jgi:hypothetical protein